MAYLIGQLGGLLPLPGGLGGIDGGLIGTLIVGYRRRPRIVMLNKLQWEPLYDVMLNRVPNRFIKHDPRSRVPLKVMLAICVITSPACTPAPPGGDARARAAARDRRLAPARVHLGRLGDARGGQLG